MHEIDLIVVLLLVALCLGKIHSAIDAKRSKSIFKMCSIPCDYRERGNVSRNALANRSGIKSFLRKLSVAEVVACLDQHPHLITAWEGDIADRRGGGGWSYGEAADGYQLGTVDQKMIFTAVASFRSRSEVCAVFVLLSTASYLNAEIPAANLALKSAHSPDCKPTT